ncbi:ATP-grasp domain-containing protein [Streptomyces erythrochromogenes]|uniref:ATP-grasp domain-containing protein n=1 Tax=Streptomyces erythrochromogenes TaxID=285574 RepID=UPI003810012B
MPEVKVALVTTMPRPEINVDHDMPLLLAALNTAEVTASSVNWDDPHIDWSQYSLVLLRSTWDYTWRSGEFLEWVDRCSRLTTLLNPPSVVHWSSDKYYLARLAEAGVPAVPTRYLTPDTTSSLTGVLPATGEYVIKPAVGAGARYAARYKAGDQDDALRHIRHMHDEGLSALVQPYMSRVEVSGERALVFFGGSFLHAIRKKAVLASDVPFHHRKVAHPGLEPWLPTPSELEVAEKALSVVPDPGQLFYARVDLVDDEAGWPAVMELELIEPNLFLAVQPSSIATVTRAISEKATQVHRSRTQPVAERI